MPSKQTVPCTWQLVEVVLCPTLGGPSPLTTKLCQWNWVVHSKPGPNLPHVLSFAIAVAKLGTSGGIVVSSWELTKAHHGARGASRGKGPTWPLQQRHLSRTPCQHSCRHHHQLGVRQKTDQGAGIRHYGTGKRYLVVSWQSTYTRVQLPS